MKKTSMSFMSAPIYAIFFFCAAMIHNGIAQADDYTLRKNLMTLSELTAKWSAKLSTDEPIKGGREKVAELLALTSQLLKDMAEEVDMGIEEAAAKQEEYSKRIEDMQDQWKPFDTSDRG